MLNKSIYIITLIVLLFLMGIPVSHAQNLELIGNKDEAFRVNGGVSLNQMAYFTSDSISRRDPYNFYANGNLNASLYGWSVPVTFSYSNQKTSFTQPFNQYSIHPYYKWIKLHAGYTSMSFSPYSLNGHLFLGGGIELAPKKHPISFSAMYGRLRKAVDSDTTSLTPTPTEFERWGYGFKLGYDYSTLSYMKAKVSVNVFHAEDRPNSLSVLPDSLLSPGENLVVGTTIDATIYSKLKVISELATSAVTSNINSEFTDSTNSGWQNNLGGLFASNATTSRYKAFKINGMWMEEFYSLGLGYEKIDPGYNSYGAYYFNNDFENITVNGTANLFDNKVNLAANVGKQRDNLDNSKASDMKRLVMAFNLNYSSGEKLNAGLSYSTFNSFMNIRPQLDNLTQLSQYDNLDTLNFTQLSTSTSLNINYILKNTEKQRQNINANFSYQQSAEKQNNDLVSPGSDFYNVNGSYSYGFIPLSLTAVLSLNASFNLMPGMNTKTFGPTFSVNKLMLNKKLRNSLAFSYNRVFTDQASKNGVFSLRYSSSVRLAKKHSINLGLTYMNRKRVVQNSIQSINEFIATLGYSYNF